MKKQWKRLAALSSAVIMAAGTLLYFPTDTLQNISWGITASAEETGAGTESGTQTWKEDNLTWTLSADGTTMTISGTGTMKDYYNENSPATQKKDNVKKVVIEEDVTSIGIYAFSGCISLTDITIPGSVTSIGDSAFQNTTWLKNKQNESPLVIVNGILIDGRTCSGEVTIPNNVTSIGNYAFYECTGLTSIEIPEGVKSIGANAFSDCTGLTSITIPKSVTSIGDEAFSEYPATSVSLIKISSRVRGIHSKNTGSQAPSFASLSSRVPRTVSVRSLPLRSVDRTSRLTRSSGSIPGCSTHWIL